jgi:hypothetical protein
VTVLWQSFDLQAGPSPSDKVSLERKKKEYCFALEDASPQNIGRYKRT